MSCMVRNQEIHASTVTHAKMRKFVALLKTTEDHILGTSWRRIQILRWLQTHMLLKFSSVL